MERLLKIEQTWVDDATGKTSTRNFEYDDKGELVGGAKGDEIAIAPGELPLDFPARDIFRRAGYGTIEAVRQFRRHKPLTSIEGIDSLTAQAVEVVLATTPEDEGNVAEATEADAKATALNEKVSSTGGGGEATAAKDTRRGAKQDGSVGSDSTLEGVADATAADGSPAAGHGTEGFLTSAGEGSHLTTNLTVADGATKVEGDAAETDTAQAIPHKGKIPDSFPGKSALDAAGVHTYGQLSKYSSDYTAIDGIGEATAKRIAEALNQ